MTDLMLLYQTTLDTTSTTPLATPPSPTSTTRQVRSISLSPDCHQTLSLSPGQYKEIHPGQAESHISLVGATLLTSFQWEIFANIIQCKIDWLSQSTPRSIPVSTRSNTQVGPPEESDETCNEFTDLHSNHQDNTTKSIRDSTRWTMKTLRWTSTTGKS